MITIAELGTDVNLRLTSVILTSELSKQRNYVITLIITFICIPRHCNVLNEGVYHRRQHKVNTPAILKAHVKLL